MTTAAAPSVEALIEGTVTGQVAVGSHILQIGSIHGGVVHVAAPGEAPRPRPRPTPVSLRPRPFPGLLDREAETGSAVAALRAAEPVELYGEPGIGKSSLLRRLAHHEAADAFPGGVVHLVARGREAGDLCQALWDAFHECDAPYVPTPATLRLDLQRQRALVVLDEVTLGRDGVEEVLDAASACTFVVSSAARVGAAGLRGVSVGALPQAEAVVLLERELGRPLVPEERAGAASLSAAVGGNPQRLLQAAAAVRDEGLPLARAARRAVEEVMSALGEVPRALLGALAALGGAPAGTEHLAELAGAPEAEDALRTLERRSLVRAEEGRWAAAPGIAPAEAEVEAWRERALAHFAGWAEARHAEPAAVAAEADALAALLAWAGERGRWEDVRRLGRALEGALALAKRPDAWEQALGWLERAGRALGDDRTVAFALHQRGTREGCLGNPLLSQPLLAQALDLREALGDHAGAAVTRHNLNVFGSRGGHGRHGSAPGPPQGGRGGVRSLAKTVAALVAALVATLIATLVTAGAAVTRHIPNVFGSGGGHGRSGGGPGPPQGGPGRARSLAKTVAALTAAGALTVAGARVVQLLTGGRGPPLAVEARGDTIEAGGRPDRPATDPRLPGVRRRVRPQRRTIPEILEFLTVGTQEVESRIPTLLIPATQPPGSLRVPGGNESGGREVPGGNEGGGREVPVIPGWIPKPRTDPCVCGPPAAPRQASPSIPHIREDP